MTLMRPAVKGENISITCDRNGSEFLLLILQYKTKTFVSLIFMHPMTKISRSIFVLN